MHVKSTWVLLGMVLLGGSGAIADRAPASEYSRSYPRLSTYYEIGTPDYSHVDSLGIGLVASRLDSVVVFLTGTGVPGEEFCGDLSIVQSIIVWSVSFRDSESGYWERASNMIAQNSDVFALSGTYYPDPEDSAFTAYLNSRSAMVAVTLYTAIQPGCWPTGVTTNAALGEVSLTFYGDFEVGAQPMSWEAVKCLYR